MVFLSGSEAVKILYHLFYMYCSWRSNYELSRSRVERLSPSSHVKEPSVTAHYAHDEWSIRDLLHWLNYPSLPISFPCFESRGVYIFKCSRPDYSWKIARWTLNTNQSINQSINRSINQSINQLSRWEGWDFINSLTPPYLCLFQSKTWISNIICCDLFVFREFSWEMIVLFIDICGIGHHHCLNFLFLKTRKQ
jgi:hypothetical protein